MNSYSRCIIVLSLIIFFIIFFTNACKDDDQPLKGTVSGRVTIENTQIPLSGVIVSIAGSQNLSSSTNEDGRFTFRELSVGSYTLDLSVPPSFQKPASKQILVRGNQESSADFAIRPKGSISGTITIEGTTTAVNGANISLKGGPENIKSESQKTDISGTFNFSSLPDGTYQLTVTHPDYATVMDEYTVDEGKQVRADISLGTEGPILEVFPTTLDFGLNENQLSIDISNEGRGELKWNIAESRDELRAFPVNGTLTEGESEPVAIELDRNLVEEGTFTYTIEVQSNAGIQDVNIDFQVVQSSLDSCESTNLQVDFEIVNNGCKAPCEIEFVNKSLNAENYIWDFGDGGTSDQFSPSHKYVKPGDYNVRLISENSVCGDSLIKPVNVQWETFETLFGGSGLNRGNSVQQTIDGGYIVAGATNNTSGEDLDILLIKTLKDGSIAWEKTIGNPKNEYASSVIQTLDGGFMILGYIRNDVTQTEQLTLVKTFSDGSTHFQRIIGEDSHTYRSGSSIIQTEDGGFVFTGRYSETGEDFDLFVIKTDPNGFVELDQKFDFSKVDNALSIIVSLDGDYVITGSTEDGSGDDIDACLIKVSNTGDLVWKKTFGGDLSDEGVSLIQSPDGGFIIGGYTTISLEGDSQIYLFKTSGNGLLLWEKGYGESYLDYANSIAATSEGGIVVTGEVYPRGRTGGADVYLLKTDALGESIWDQTFRKTLFNTGYSVDEAEDGGYVISGTSFDPGSLGTSLYIIKTDDKGNVQ